MVAGCGDHAETDGGGPGDAAGGARSERVQATRIQHQVAERGHAGADSNGRSAARRKTARAAGHR